jgi:predicted esterase
MAILKHMVVPKTVRFYQSREINNHIKNIWVVLHGYGHLAEFFIRKFDALIDDSSMVIAPEGMHRFYLNGVSGRVGASWMTKEDRENDINDYIQYLTTLIQSIALEANPLVKINLIGFSQGGATACRLAMASEVKLNALVLYSSVFPPDLNLNPLKINYIPFIIALMGDEDEYVSEVDFRGNIEVWNQLGLKAEPIFFKGKHEINPETLQLIKVKLG